MQTKAILSLLLGASLVLGADFSMTEKTEFTGGTLVGALKVAAKFSKNLDTTTVTTQHYSGNKMATIGAHSIQIIDLDAGTMTAIDPDKKTYSVITLAEFGQAMGRMMERMGQKTKEAKQQNPDTDVNFSFNVDSTGRSKDIAGVPAKQIIFIMTMQATDKKSGQSGSSDIVIDSWMGEVAGYETAKAFNEKMAQAIGAEAFASMRSNPFVQQQGFGKGMAEMREKMAGVEGVPVLQITRMVAAGQGQAIAEYAKGDAAGQPLPKQEGPSVKESVAGAAIGGVLGGFGGFGRKKKKPEPEQQQAAQYPAAAAVLMEIVTETTAVSSNPVDPAVFQVPAGFKQVEHEMKKLLKN